VSNFQWVWRYSCLNVTHKKPYKRYEDKTPYMYIYRVFQEEELIVLEVVVWTIPSK